LCFSDSISRERSGSQPERRDRNFDRRRDDSRDRRQFRERPDESRGRNERRDSRDRYIRHGRDGRDERRSYSRSRSRERSPGHQKDEFGRTKEAASSRSLSNINPVDTFGSNSSTANSMPKSSAAQIKKDRLAVVKSLTERKHC
jgi:hypothetical protein